MTKLGFSEVKTYYSYHDLNPIYFSDRNKLIQFVSSRT